MPIGNIKWKPKELMGVSVESVAGQFFSGFKGMSSKEMSWKRIYLSFPIFIHC